MKILYSLTRNFLCLLFLFTLSLSVFGADPGAPVRDADDARRPVPSSERPGSLLIYNFYSSSATDAGKADTEFSVTNISTSQAAFVHLFVVSNGGSVADAYTCLTPNQTTSFLASDLDPGITGYAVFYATDRAGCPISFNYLIGSERFKLESGQAAVLSAESYAALYNGTLPGCLPATGLTTLPLDGVRYTAAPQLLGVDKIPSPGDGNSTMLILNILEGNLAIGVGPLRQVSGTLFNDTEDAFSFSASLRQQGGAQFRTVLSDSFPTTTPKFTQIVKPGQTGWMRIMDGEGRGISGAVINLNPDAASRKGAFNGGHNLHHLRLGGSSFTVPVFEPSC
jgi:hypothetical protein